MKAFRRILELVIIVVVAVAIVGVLRTFVIASFEVPTGSMISTIEVGDRILSTQLAYVFDEPNKGDIITFDSPMEEGVVLVKRCIATGGDVVDLKDGDLYLNGQKQHEAYTHGQPSYPLYPTFEDMQITYPFTVPTGYIWVMGDNRTHSADSRYFGAVPVDLVSGKVVFRYWPLDRFGFL